ncbi:MAG: tRNA (guanosine(46)-N7)-methyltransferase TrmB [Balneolaceae bacterium]|nr:tRNA (guanosine(46)-N7)-methyltransferase TrmB [Balneolaceae bacterium]
MGKNKLERFEEIGTFENVLELTDFQDGEDEKPRGRWASEIFGNGNPLTLELACGKGEYALELARRNPTRNFVGVDIKGARIWKGAKRALDQELSNVRFLRIYIDHLPEYFRPGEVEEIWITFPDPYPRSPDRNKRLTDPKFLAIYRQVLAAGAPIHLKTDSDLLFGYTREVISEQGCHLEELVEDVHGERPDDELLGITTYYEEKHLRNGKTIHYVRFRLREEA